MKQRLIGVDSGGTVTKVALFDLTGSEVACESRKVALSTPNQGFTERDPNDLWNATADAIKTLLEKTETQAKDILAIAPTGFGCGGFFLDGKGRPSRPGIVSTDTRASNMVASFYSDGAAYPAEKEGCTRILPGHTSSLMAWLQVNEKNSCQNTSHVLWCKDYLRFRLTGNIATDYSDATCPGLWNYKKDEWSSTVFESLGISSWLSRMPDVQAATDIAGYVHQQAALETGLMEGTPVATSAYDIVSTSLASGIIGPEQMGLIGGTFAIASLLSPSLRNSNLPNHQSAYPFGSLYISSSASATSGSNLEWFIEKILFGLNDLTIEKSELYSKINGLVSDASSEYKSIYFMPYLFSKESLGLFGVTASDNLSDILCAIFRGIICAHKIDVEQLVGGDNSVSLKNIRLAGGISKSDIWAQMYADAFNLPVEIPSGGEFGAKGAAMCAAVAVGAFDNMGDALNAMVSVERRFLPAKEEVEKLEQYFGQFQSCKKNIEDISYM